MADQQRYGFSGVRETLGRHSMVAIVDRMDKDARIAFVPFSNRYPPLKQPDVELIVGALNRCASSEEIGWAKATAWHVHGIAWKHLEKTSQVELIDAARAALEAQK